jgi:Tol biopolymer transport system component
MKKSLLLLMWAWAMVAGAQQVTVTSTTPLLRGIEPAFYPTLSPSGDRLLYSDVDARGLKMLDLGTQAVTTISEQTGAGFDAKWSNDGQVYYITSKVDEKSRLVFRTGMRYDLKRQASDVVLEAQHGAVHLETGTQGMAMNGESHTFATAPKRGVSVYTTGSQLVVNVDGKESRYTPVESYAGYLWSSVSPAGDKIAFYAAGRGIVVTTLQGKVLAELGNYEMPCWYNNDYLVAQNASDDGYQYTSSQILLLKADGTSRHELTPKTSMTMQPTAGGGKIVYTTIDGNLTMITLDINE